MDFYELAQARQSCRKYDPTRPVEEEKLDRILAVGRLAPSACNGQPYHITLCRGETAKRLAPFVQGLGINKFADNVSVFLVLSEKPYVKSAALGAKFKGNDYRSLDIGILSAYLTAQATEEGLGSCILGWFDNEKICKFCGLDGTVRLVIALGYAAQGDPLRPKKRKELTELVHEAKGE